jgi:hypothetical protein
MDAPAPRGDGRDHVGFERIAHHHRGLGAGAVAGEDAGIDGGGLVGNDLDRVEKIAKARLRELAFLIEKVALGDQQHAVAPGGGLDRGAGMGQQFDRMGQHVAPRCHQFGDDRGGHAGIRHLDRGFDHGKDEPLHAKAVMAKVAPFGGQKAFMQVVGIGVIGQQVGEAGLRQAEERLVLPERVIGIKADRGKG